MLIKVKIKPETNHLFLKHYQKKITRNYHIKKERISTRNLKLPTYIIIGTNKNETQRASLTY